MRRLIGGSNPIIPTRAIKAAAATGLAGAALVTAGCGGDKPPPLDNYKTPDPAACKDVTVPTNPALEALRAGQDPATVVVDTAGQWQLTQQAAKAMPSQLGQNPNALAPLQAQRPVLCEVIFTSGPIIAAKTQEYHELKGRVSNATGTVKKNINARLKTLEHELRELRAAAGGAETMLRVLDKPQAEATSEQAAIRRLITALDNSKVEGHDAVVHTLRELELGYQAVSSTANAQQSSADDMQTDLRDYAHHKGASGNVKNAAKTQGKAQASDADLLHALVDSTDARIRSEVNQLLISENPAYAAQHAKYELLRPVHDELNAIVELLPQLNQKLSDAQSAITYRNGVALMEPSRTTTCTDANGKISTCNNPAHDSWEFQMSMARNRAYSETHDAEKAVKSLNGHLATLKIAMGQSGMRSSLPEVSHDIDATLGYFTDGLWRWGMWSYDGGQVRDVQRDVSKLEQHLSPLRDGVERAFQPLSDSVHAQLNARRAALTQPAGGMPVPNSDAALPALS